eukprot:gene4227-14341_t
MQILVRVKGTAEGNSAAVIIVDKEQNIGAVPIGMMIGICELGLALAEQKSLLQDIGNEAEVTERRIADLEHVVDSLLVKSDVRQIEMERLRVAAAGRAHDRKIQELELAMEKQRRGLEEEVRETEAECSRLKVLINEAEVRRESISLAGVRADIQGEIEKCPDPAAKEKMLKDLILKWHPDKNPALFVLASEVFKLIDMFRTK